MTLTLARDSGGASSHRLLGRVLTGEAAKDDQTGGQAGEAASKLQGEGGYSSPSRPRDTKKLFIV